MHSFLRSTGIALAFLGLSSVAAATTIDAGYWNPYFYGANPPSKGAAIDWSPNGFVPDEPALAQFSQSGSRIVLKPNVSFCQNALGQAQGDIDYWCYTAATPDKGKWLKTASFDHTNVPVGPASTVDFQGCIVSNTLTEHTFTAFVKVFNSDYSQLWYEEYDGSGTFSLPATLAGDAEVNVQVGFEMEGPTVSPNDIDDFGSVVVDMGGPCAAAPTPEFDPNAIPALPFGGLLGLIGLVGWLGLRRRT
jgi:hypothetical protein